jgi:CubicO group peptidase (beta-lactamase class C family)/streptogramin lyase
MEGAIASLGEEQTSDVHEGSRIRRLLAAVGGAAAALLLAGAAVWSHGAAGSGTSAEAASIRSYLSGLEQQGQFSGVALVTKPGQILLSQGYGFADREDHIRNSPQTLYPLGGLGYAISYQLALQLAEAGKISLSSHICSYISRCPSSWRAITIEMVADGTSRLPDYPWGASPTPAEYNVRHCAAMPLDTVPPGATDYGKSCDVIVLDTVIERTLHRPWAALLSQYILTPAGMKHSGRLYDSLRPPARARDYSGSVPGDPSQGSSGTGAIFNVYSTAPDILRYDNALFGGKLVTAHGLQRILTPRDLVLPPDPSIKGARNGWSWHVGRLMGRRAVYTEGNLSNFYCFDLRLPQDGVTVIVLSNNSENDATEIGVNIAQFAVGKEPSLPGPPLPARAADPSRAIQTTIDAKIPGDTPALLPGSLWLSNPDVGTLTRIDTRIDAYALSVPLGTHNLSCPGCGAVTIPMAGEGQLWSADATSLVRINPRTNKVAERIPVGPGTSDLALTGHTLWVTSTGKVFRVDLRRRRVVAIVHGFANPQMIVASRDAAWVTDSWSESVKRINPATDRIVANIHVGEDPEALALGFGSLWVMNGTGGIISRVDPRTNRVSATIVVGHGVRNMYSSPWGRGVTVGFGRVWTVVHDDGKLVSIDPRTNRPVAALTIPVPPSEKTVAPYQVAVGDGSVWVYADPHYVFRIDPKAMR